MKLLPAFIALILLGVILNSMAAPRIIYSDRYAFTIRDKVFFQSEVKLSYDTLKKLKCLMPQSLLLEAVNFDPLIDSINLDSIIKVKKLLYFSMENNVNKLIEIDPDKKRRCQVDETSKEIFELKELYVNEINLQKKFGSFDSHNAKRNQEIKKQLALYIGLIDQKIHHVLSKN